MGMQGSCGDYTGIRIDFKCCSTKLTRDYTLRQQNQIQFIVAQPSQKKHKKVQTLSNKVIKVPAEDKKNKETQKQPAKSTQQSAEAKGIDQSELFSLNINNLKSHILKRNNNLDSKILRF